MQANRNDILAKMDRQPSESDSSGLFFVLKKNGN